MHEPSFRLVLTDSKNSTKSGRFEEVLGSYDPRKLADSFNTERIKHWLSKGIALTPSVNNLLIRHRIISGKKIDVAAKAPVAPQTASTEVEAAPVPEVKEEKEEVAAPEAVESAEAPAAEEAKPTENPEVV